MMGQHYARMSGLPKKAHSTEQSVLAHVYDLMQLYPHDTYSVYKCFCKAWHVGHKATNPKVKTWERQMMATEERLVGRLIGALRGTTPYRSEAKTRAVGASASRPTPTKPNKGDKSNGRV